ncbi:MAG: hypothetical protein HRU26_09065 [Psychroserpens sp.]|nr:hypothetical protein [Psychroserpens sp.]
MRLLLLLPIILCACASTKHSIGDLDTKESVIIEVPYTHLERGSYDHGFDPDRPVTSLRQEIESEKHQSHVIKTSRAEKKAARISKRVAKKAAKRKYKLDKKKIPTNSQVRQGNKSKRVESRSNKKIVKSNNSVIKTETRNNRKKTNKLLGLLKIVCIFVPVLTITIIYYAKSKKVKNDRRRSEVTKSSSEEK